eukprot:PhM_4_TR3412/c2_g1_i1/m.82369/K06188/aqpZ; aquaporin Z
MPREKTRDFVRMCLGEAWIMFIYLFCLGLVGRYAGTFAPLSVGFIIAALIYAFANLSGAHFNPSISICVWAAGLMPGDRCVGYMITQTVFGLFGLYCGTVVSGIRETMGAPMPPLDDSANEASAILKALVVEFVFMVIYSSVVLSTSFSRDKFGPFGALAAGVTIASELFMFPMAGINPGVSTALQLMRCFYGKCDAVEYMWIYWVGSLPGAALGGLIFKHLGNPQDADWIPKEKEQQTGAAQPTVVVASGDDAARKRNRCVCFCMCHTEVEGAVNNNDKNNNNNNNSSINNSSITSVKECDDEDMIAVGSSSMAKVNIDVNDPYMDDDER